MRLVLVLLLALAATARAQERAGCGTCHGEQATAFAGGAHAGVLDCTDCHGGDATAARDKVAAHAPEAGFTGRVARADVAALCGDCHSDPLRMLPYGLRTDQLAHWQVSGHGRALLERGDASAATCVDCHGSHGIRRAVDPAAPTAHRNQPQTCGRCHEDHAAMQAHGLSPQVVDQFREGVHGRALLRDEARGAPACSDCHGAHAAAPPGPEGVVDTCTRCHVNTGEQFKAGPHATHGTLGCLGCHEDGADTEALRVTGCAACHGAHAIAPPGEWMLEGSEPGRCGHCHREPDGAAAAIAALRDGRAALRDAMQRTRADLAAAKARGLFLENEEIHLRESERTLVAVGPLSHGLDAAAISAHLDDAVRRQDTTREMIDRKARALRDRALLVGGVALLLLLLLGLLWFKLDALRRLS